MVVSVCVCECDFMTGLEMKNVCLLLPPRALSLYVNRILQYVIQFLEWFVWTTEKHAGHVGVVEFS